MKVKMYLCAALAACILSPLVQAAVEHVICVPWQGDPLKYHTGVSGQPTELKGVIKTDNTAVIYYRWVFGDGSQSTACSSWYR